VSRADERPLEPHIAAARGLTPAQRAGLIAAAKKVAIRFAWAVKTKNAPVLQQISDGLDRDQLAALATVLAAATDPTDLRVIVEATDDGLPEHVRATPQRGTTHAA
jgi:hypothetical protein